MNGNAVLKSSAEAELDNFISEEEDDLEAFSAASVFDDMD